MRSGPRTWYVALITITCPTCHKETASAYASFRKNRCIICKQCGFRMEELDIIYQRIPRGNQVVYRAVYQERENYEE